MPKSIYLTDEQYAAVVAHARKCGFRVQRGRGSQLAAFIVASAEAAQNNGRLNPIPLGDYHAIQPTTFNRKSA